MPTDTTKEIARRSIRDVWNNGRFEMIDELFTENFVQHHTAAGPDIENRAEYRSFIEALRAAMPDLTTVIHTTVADTEEAIIHYASTGTHTDGPLRGIEATNQTLEWEGMIRYTFCDGRISEAWIQYDELGMLRQLGIVSPPEPGESVEP